MKTAALAIASLFFFFTVVGILRAVFERRFPFIKSFNDETRPAYTMLALAAAGIFVWTHVNLRDWHVESVEVGGVKASLTKLENKVETLQEQMELFFKSKRIEVFNRQNWSAVRRVGKTREGVILAVTLQNEPIPGSVEVYEGVLLMPELSYQISGRNLQFLANSDTPVDGLTIKYYPRLPEPSK